MYVRKKLNKSGVVSIQVIAKIKGKSKLIKTIGSSKDKKRIKELEKQAYEYIHSYGGQSSLNFSDIVLYEKLLTNIYEHKEVGTEFLLGNIFNEIGFYKLNNDIFKHLVLARLVYPTSKLKTSDYLIKYKNIDIPVQQLYRYLDKLYKDFKERIQQISYEHTLIPNFSFFT